MHRHSWFDSVKQDLLSGGGWISNFSKEEGTADSKVEVTEAGDYTFWIRANPTATKLSWALDTGDWQAVDFKNELRGEQNIAADGKPDLRFIAWVKAGASRYEYKVQSPRSIALLADRKFGDFVFEAELLQTGADYGHRDLCLFFGFEDPGHYYYVHFASKTDDRANQIFIVNEKPFTKITSKTTSGSEWGADKWHKVRVQRIGGTITVWFDDMEKPAMLAEDKTFGSGYIGFGSYNDSGMFANVRLWAPSAEKVVRSGSVFAK